MQQEYNFMDAALCRLMCADSIDIITFLYFATEDLGKTKPFPTSAVRNDDTGMRNNNIQWKHHYISYYEI
jgi:hypothetical protein